VRAHTLSHRLHTKAVKRLERHLTAATADYDTARQELLIKSAELLDVQAQLKEAGGQAALADAAAEDEVRGVLRVVAGAHQRHACCTQQRNQHASLV
jgi:hypothetical protein